MSHPVPKASLRSNKEMAPVLTRTLSVIHRMDKVAVVVRVNSAVEPALVEQAEPAILKNSLAQAWEHVCAPVLTQKGRLSGPGDLTLTFHHEVQVEFQPALHFFARNDRINQAVI